MDCKICGKIKFSKNHLRTHNITAKEYYDKYIKTNNDNCINCGKETWFINLKKGCRKYCSNECANFCISINKKNKYKEKKLNEQINRKCKNCNKEFLTNINNKNEYCNYQTCRKLNTKQTFNKEDIKFKSLENCPYCEVYKIKNYSNFIQHLKKHFGIKYDVKEVFLFLLKEILKLEIPKCKNENCDNIPFFRVMKDKVKYSMLCSNCSALFYTNRNAFFKARFTENEFREINKQRGFSIKKTRDKKIAEIPGYKEKLNNQLKIAAKAATKNRINFYKTEEGKEKLKEIGRKISTSLKEKILNGYTPVITNRRTNWTANIILENGEIKKFRSSWEACFWFCNQNLLFEKIRVKYILNDDKYKITIPDFFDEHNKIIYEIKPKTFFEKENLKIQAVINYCFENNLIFIWINEDNILDYIDINKVIKSEKNKVQLLKLLKGIGKYDIIKRIENNEY